MTSEAAASPRLDWIDWIRCAAAVVGTLFFATGFDLYGYDQLSTPNPTHVNLALAGVVVVVVVASLRRPLPFVRSPLAIWIFAWILVTTVWAMTLGVLPGRDDLMERYKAIFLLVTLAAIYDDPRAQKAASWALAASVVVMTVANVADLLGWVEFNRQMTEIYARQRVEGRASGLIYNSNEAGRTIVLATAVAFWGIPKSLRMPLLLVGAIGVTTTFSRGSMIALALFVAWVMWKREVGGWPALAVGLVAVAAGGWWAATHGVGMLASAGAWNEDVQGRLRLSQWVSEDSGRGALLADAWDAFLRSPLAGHPFGQAELLAPHNMYVAFAVDHGVVGFLLLPALAVALVLTNRRQALGMAALLLLAGMFSHVLVIEHGAIVAIALAGTSGAGAAREAESPGLDAAVAEAVA